MIAIRYGTLDDAELLAEFGAKAFADTFAKDNTEANLRLFLASKYSPEHQRRELLDPAVLFLIAEMDGETVGYAKLNLNSRDESVQTKKTMEIERIYTAHKLTGAGIGSELMRACLREAQEHGYESVWLGVWEKNPRAIAFYQKWGFKEVGTHVFPLGDDPQRDYIMELVLSK